MIHSGCKWSTRDVGELPSRLHRVTVHHSYGANVAHRAAWGRVWVPATFTSCVTLLLGEINDRIHAEKAPQHLVQEMKTDSSC